MRHPPPPAHPPPPCAHPGVSSGDGMTYSGAGGVLVPLGTESISSPFLSPDAAWEGPQGSTDFAAITLCVSGANGGRPAADGTCALPLAAAVAQQRPDR